MNSSRNYANDNCYAHFGRVVGNPFISFNMTQYAAQGQRVMGTVGAAKKSVLGHLTLVIFTKKSTIKFAKLKITHHNFI